MSRGRDPLPGTLARDPPPSPPLARPAGRGPAPAATAAADAEPVPGPDLARVTRQAFDGPVVEVARALLGLVVVRDDPAGRSAGRIVETEAYGGPEDRASHARAGLTRRTAPMFGPPGHAYVYLVYGLHHCLNVVAEPDGIAAAVLVRALEPLAGVDLMRLRRGGHGGPDRRLAAGPARACQALAVDRSLDGIDLVTDERLWIASAPGFPPVTDAHVISGPRVGVGYAGAAWAERPWRFGLRDSPSLSRPFPEAA